MKRVSILSLLLCACATTEEPYGPNVDTPALASKINLYPNLLEKTGLPITLPYSCEALQGNEAFGGDSIEYILNPPPGVLIGDETECVVSLGDGEIQ